MTPLIQNGQFNTYSISMPGKIHQDEKGFFGDPFCYLCFVSYCFVCFLQSCGHLLGKRCPLGSLVCDVFLCFVTLTYGVFTVLGQVWYNVFNCMDSFLTLTHISLASFWGDIGKQGLHCLLIECSIRI